MAALCLFLNKTKAQSQLNQSVQIGQKIPEVTLTNLYNYKTSKINLADFDKRLIIIDFWATWCTPCIAMIPKMDSLQKEFANELQIISVSYQDKDEVLPFMEKLEKRRDTHYQVPIVTNDKVLRKMFPHQTLPHFVWIGADGTVKAITGLEEITAVNIQKILNNEPLSLREKKEIMIPYDYNKPLLINNNGGNGDQLTYHSLLTGYIEGLPGMYNIERKDNKEISRLTVVNCAILWLYQHAYGAGYSKYFQKNRIAMEVSHPEELTSNLIGMPYLDWLRKPGHGVCYEIMMPVAQAGQLYPLMRKELELLFPQYIAVVESRKVKSMALVRLDRKDKVKTKHPGGPVIEKFDAFGFTLQNSTIKALMDRVQILYQQNSPVPFVDETGYDGRIDLNVTVNLGSKDDMNRALKTYGLGWKEMTTKLDILVIRDSVKKTGALKEN
jgi:thiol-disulfide isomerase/thioredoxin